MTNKKTIIAIVGNSGSGKTTLSLYLNDVFGIPFVCSYTTRPMRIGEIDGIDHIFVSDSDLPKEDDILAYTLYGGYQYWATKSQVCNVTSYVIDEKGLLYLKNKFGDEYNIITVYLQRSDTDVENNRTIRDSERITFDKNLYNLFIINNFETEKEMCKQCSKMIVNLLKDRKIK